VLFTTPQKDTRSTLQNIKTKAVHYPSHLSPGAKDFIATALNRDPSRRPTITELLEHPWMLHFTRKRRDKLAAMKEGAARVQRSKSDLSSYQAQVRGGGVGRGQLWLGHA
jgi:serine/threonine protein kinase